MPNVIWQLCLTAAGNFNCGTTHACITMALSTLYPFIKHNESSEQHPAYQHPLDIDTDKLLPTQLTGHVSNEGRDLNQNVFSALRIKISLLGAKST